jgi:tetratricopeptide (TPR) repeat protein
MGEARARFRAALTRCDGDQYARTGLGYVELREGNADEAERLWSAVLVAEPSNVDALVGVGLARWRSGDIDAVLARFTRVLELSPGHPTALEYLERVSAAMLPEPTAEEDRADQAFREGELDLALRLYQDRLAYDSDDLARAIQPRSPV